mgnify:CR=1 FL=1
MRRRDAGRVFGGRSMRFADGEWLVCGSVGSWKRNMSGSRKGFLSDSFSPRHSSSKLGSALGLSKTFKFLHLFSPRHSSSKLGSALGLSKTFPFGSFSGFGTARTGAAVFSTREKTEKKSCGKYRIFDGFFLPLCGTCAHAETMLRPAKSGTRGRLAVSRLRKPIRNTPWDFFH